jgi:hypothetical protein
MVGLPIVLGLTMLKDNRMKYKSEISRSSNDPAHLEALYHVALESGESYEFQQDLISCRSESPGNVLYAAWFYRLEMTAQAKIPASTVVEPDTQSKAIQDRTAVWRLAIPLAFLSALAIGLLFASEIIILDYMLFPALAWSPLAGAIAILFFYQVIIGKPEARSRGIRAIITILLMGIGLFYAIWIARFLVEWYMQSYLDQMALHLPLLAWFALGITLLGIHSFWKDRFSFLIKSIETVIVAGLYLGAGIAFGVITIGLFSAVSIELPEQWLVFLAGAGIGLIPITALATIYDPRLRPTEQDFNQGLSRFTAFMLRLFLPLTLAVLIIYALIIPFRFTEPFVNRDVLIVYNVMLFAVMGLLLGATPLFSNELTPRMQGLLRKGMIAAAVLAVLISIYALSAIIYRTLNDHLTINRLVIIGWNVINIIILAVLAFKVWRAGDDGWIEQAQRVFSHGILSYLVWTLVVIFVIPLLFLIIP